jgi:hypothetical protein
MRTPRFNNRLDQRPSAHWTRLSDLSQPRVSRRKKFFAVVSPPIVTGGSRKSIRHVLIYDNHPDTLRLLNDVDFAGRRKANWQILIGVGLAVFVALGIFLWWL